MPLLLCGEDLFSQEVNVAQDAQAIDQIAQTTFEKMLRDYKMMMRRFWANDNWHPQEIVDHWETTPEGAYTRFARMAVLRSALEAMKPGVTLQFDASIQGDFEINGASITILTWPHKDAVSE